MQMRHHITLVDRVQRPHRYDLFRHMQKRLLGVTTEDKAEKIERVKGIEVPFRQ